MTIPPLPAAPMTPPGKPTRWRDLGPDDAMDYWPILDAWVRWWIEREGIPTSVVPPCWYMHGRIVEELTALERGYDTLYHPTSPGNGALSFRREVEASRIRLANHTTTLGCDAENHRDERPIDWLARADFAEAFREWVELDLTERERGITLAAPSFGQIVPPLLP